MADTKFIETGVDKLVDLVKRKKKISLPEAAKTLGVSPVVVEEWADFLEEEGIISIKYKFTTPYLTERLLTREEIEKKGKEFSGKKDAFVRKAEVTLSLLDKEGEAFQKIREQFDDIKKNLGSEIKKVKGDLKELEKYEELKRSIDSKIVEQQKAFHEQIIELENQLKKEEKRYSDIISEIDTEEKKLEKEKMTALSIRESEAVLRQRLDSFRKMIEKLEQSIDSEDKVVADTEDHISRLKEVADGIKVAVEKRKNELDSLFAESKEQENNILEMQKSILDKATEKKKQIEDRIESGKGASKKFKNFFEKKADIDGMLNEINSEKDALEKELIMLIKKAKAFSIASKSQEMATNMAKLKSTFKHVEKKKGAFEKGIRKLINIMGR